jgi:hypothetical protein
MWTEGGCWHNHCNNDRTLNSMHMIVGVGGRLKTLAILFRKPERRQLYLSVSSPFFQGKKDSISSPGRLKKCSPDITQYIGDPSAF